MLQLILHLIGDYLTQSDWMAQNKTKSTWAAFCHATVYSLPFACIASLNAWLVIWSTHLLIDRFRLARYVVWLKNRFLQPLPPNWHELAYHEPAKAKVPTRLLWEERWSWQNNQVTGYPSDAPPWLAVWLLIAADNTLHLAINYLALAHL